mmetsp:Transcript_4360/g.6419  ORF Transcript_4360/g.6419 Transcript_4360/m.6419 type:complete len:292 (+) Transcript_4360:76-951(+)
MGLDVSDETIRFSAGLVAGTLSAVAFNPWDRALYLSVTQKRAFFHKRNWLHPYRGFGQSIFIRIAGSGMYFPLKDYSERALLNLKKSQNYKDAWYWDKVMINFYSGNIAGAINGVTLNALNAIKYHSWGPKESYTFMETTMHMYRKGGIYPFVRGMTSTVLRDMVFGSIYSTSKFWFSLKLQEQHLSGMEHQIINASIPLFSGLLATIVSAPFNYSRNVMYAIPPGQPIPSAMTIYKDLWLESKDQPYSRVRYISSRLRLGWASSRVAIGMAFGNWVYDLFLWSCDTKIYL